MKKITYTLSVAMALFFITCTPKNSGETKQAEMKSSSTGSIDPTIRVPLTVAASNVRRYDSLSMSGAVLPEIKAFSIRSMELLEAMGLSESLTASAKYNHVRAYLGIDSQNNYKLYIVPVDSASLADNNGGYDVPLLDTATNEKFVLDLNTPCPSLCAKNAIFSSNQSANH